MANVKLTQQDIDYIARVVETEVPRSLATRNPAEYDRMVRGVVDTVTNRMASGTFPSSATGVLNQKRQFSKITGPSRLDPYGSVENTPRASSATKNLVADHIAGRAAGAPTTIGGALNYANPNFSSKNNLTSWINPMIERGATMLGVGKNVHWHGTAPNLQPVGDYALSAEGMPGGYVPRPTSPDDLPQSAQADGILSAINPAAQGLVERRDLPPVSAGLLDQPTPSTATAFADPRGPNWENPFAAVTPQQETPPSMSIADQYASYGAGRAAPLQAGLLSEDVAYQRMIDGLNAQKQQLQAGVNPMDNAAPWTQPAAQPVTTQPAPQEVAQVEVPQAVSYEQTASVPGLLSPEEQRMFEAQRLSLVNAPVNHRPQVANAVKGILGTVGGGILGGLLAGPLGAIGGGLLGKSVITPGGIGNRDFPKKPNSKSRGDGRLTEYGRSVRDSSDQFDRAMDQGGVGLY